jgi:ubiquinone/menaquinone biosynthesis C-methylase UbiE
MPGICLYEVEPDLYSVCEPGIVTNTYDEAGAMAFYDRVACNRLYNWLMWGYCTSAFDQLAREKLALQSSGWVLDVGCGSLAFTARSYAGFSDRPVVFMDQSLKLLRKAQSRMICTKQLSPTMLFVHGDAMQMPFVSGLFDTVIAMNLLHVIEDIEGLLREIIRVSIPGLAFVFTTLVETGRWSDRYLRMWGRAGELVPRTAKGVEDTLSRFFGQVFCKVEGNMAFVTSAMKETSN